jgi:hypothetical protein
VHFLTTFFFSHRGLGAGLMKKRNKKNQGCIEILRQKSPLDLKNAGIKKLACLFSTGFAFLTVWLKQFFFQAFFAFGTAQRAFLPEFL